MHKRRLAVVVSTSRRTTLQVVPITSQEPATTDKTTFELSDETLKQLKFYGNSGKRSWAIASMIETVSTRRVLPPVSYYEGRGGVRSGRDTNYSVSLSSSETRSLKEALLHSISVRDYYENQSALANAKARISVLEPLSDRVNELEAQLLTLLAETEHLRLCKEVADMWATNMNLDLLDEVDMLRALYSGR
nr:type II toxin-antitoxin system PemK/MazF family toxin [Stenotrophomonas maltophilia]